MEKPYFETDKEYPVIYATDKSKKGIARWLGFARPTEFGYFQAVFDVTLENGKKDYSVGQTELFFIEE